MKKIDCVDSSCYDENGRGNRRLNMRKGMLNKVFKAGLVFLAALGLATGLGSPTAIVSAAGPTPGTSPDWDAISIQGNISAISGNFITITPSNIGLPVTLSIDSNTNIDLSGLNSLAVGQTVVADYNSCTLLAEMITVINLTNVVE
jgi:hypothetical protein